MKRVWTRLRGAVRWTALAIVLVVMTGCHHREKTTQIPPQQLPPAPVRQPPAASQPGAKIPVTPVPPGGVSEEDFAFVASHQPILSEIGYATWYTAPYKGRHAANGEVFDGNALTAAHRTLPMGSLIVVTNLKTGQSSAMRISDRGPFVGDRMIDLTIASAKAIGVYQAGLAQVRMDVYQTPKPINTGGRWCVQIGAFHKERDALRLKEQLLKLYPSSNVMEFPGENSFWVRIRPQGDDRAMAAYIAQHTQPVEGNAYLTRLD
ncbi:MAG: septal ring lytic transglycosylase RlpA family protein [Terracidiphilus sp.]|jgi:rare lipoprotein A